MPVSPRLGNSYFADPAGVVVAGVVVAGGVVAGGVVAGGGAGA